MFERLIAFLIAVLCPPHVPLMPVEERYRPWHDDRRTRRVAPSYGSPANRARYFRRRTG